MCLAADERTRESCVVRAHHDLVPPLGQLAATCNHDERPRNSRPPVSDTIGIAEFVRLRGSVDYPLEAVPGDFALWRRTIRDEAKRLDIRVSVIRSGDTVLVHNPDHAPSQDELRATMAVVGSLTADLLAQPDEPPTAPNVRPGASP